MIQFVMPWNAGKMNQRVSRFWRACWTFCTQTHTQTHRRLRKHNLLGGSNNQSYRIDVEDAGCEVSICLHLCETLQYKILINSDTHFYFRFRWSHILSYSRHLLVTPELIRIIFKNIHWSWIYDMRWQTIRMLIILCVKKCWPMSQSGCT